jgi:GTPase SAR1 family protein
MKNNYQDAVKKLTQFSKKFIHHHSAAQALSLMERAIQAVDTMRDTDGEIDPQFQPKDFNFKLVGKSGTGKTTLCEKTLANHYPHDIVINDVKVRNVPCLYCSVESPPTIKNLAKSMLTFLGDIKPDQGTVYDVTTRVKDLLINCRTNLIIIDEFHHLLNGTAKKTVESLDWLKRLTDDTRIPVVVCGLPNSLALFQSESQMAKRFPKDILLTEHKWSKPDDTPGEFGQYC